MSNPGEPIDFEKHLGNRVLKSIRSDWHQATLEFENGSKLMFSIGRSYDGRIILASGIEYNDGEVENANDVN